MASNDFVISTNLVVFGMSTFTGGQTFDGQMIVDLTDTEALLVRKNNDGGDVFTVDTATDPTLVIVTGNIIGANASGPAFLNEAAADNNPTLIPRRADLTTGIGGADAEGNAVLALIVEGSKKLDLSNGAATWFSLASGMRFNFGIEVLGVADTEQFKIQGHSTQTSDLVLIERSDGTDLLTLSNAGLLTMPLANSAISLGPNASATGDVRFGNTRFIAWRNMNNNGDVQALSVDEDDFLNIGSAAALKTRILSPSFLALGASGHAFGAAAINSVLTIDTTSTADGGGTTAFAVNFFPDYTGASGLTEAIALMNLGGNIQTQITDTITNVSTLVVADPSISVGAGATVTNAQSLLISGAPTEGTNNYALRVQSGDVLFSDLQLGVGVSSLAGIFQIEFAGNFLSDGSNVFATNFRVTPGLIGAAGDTDSLITARFEGSVSTQTATESIANIAQVRIATPPITDNLTGGGLITTAQTLLLVGSPTAGVNNLALRSTGPAPTLFEGVQFVIGRSTVEDFVQFRLDGSFTSGGGSNLVSGAMFASDITSASGDVALSHIRAGVTGGGSLVTSGAGDSVFAATLWLDEPNITLTPSDAMALAATLYISGAPTEGTSNNYSLFIDNGSARFDGAVQMFANSQFVNPANTFTFGSGVDQTHTHVAIIGAFTSSGISNHAERVFIGGSLTGFAVDTLSLAGLLVDASITTQGNTDVIADVAQLILNEPDITVGTGDTITNASTLSILGAPTEGVSNWALRVVSGDVLLGGNLAVSGVGPHSIAGVTFGAVQLLIGSTFTSDGASDIAAGLFHTPAIVGAPGDTSALTGTTLTAGITTQTATESIANIAQLQVNEPAITDNLTGDITLASTVLITGAPTEGLANYALRVVSGATFLGGELEHAGSTLGFFGTSPTTQPAAYTRNATIVEDRTLLASASATALNNNNVLAALIADLQSLGVIG